MAMLTPGGDKVCRTTDIMSDAAYGKAFDNICPDEWPCFKFNALFRNSLPGHRVFRKLCDRRRVLARKIWNRRFLQLQVRPLRGRRRPHDGFFPARKIRLAEYLSSISLANKLLFYTVCFIFIYSLGELFDTGASRLVLRIKDAYAREHMI